MFRNFDNWDVYYDRDGNRLSGCVQFNLKDGTTPAAIFDGDGTPIANPVLTDDMGRTERQVFVRSDVLAYFYRYVGQGSLADEEVDGIDPSDESKWALQYTVESAAIDERSVSGDSAMGVGTIAELRAIDPGEVPEVDGAKIICLHGYYTAGDKEPVWYVWYPQSVKNDDNGSVIQPDGVLTGRWIMVPPSCHCDSRHFGIFPQDSQYSEIDQTTQIGTFIDYCNVKSLHPYFNGSQEAPYFIYTSIAVDSVNPIVVSDGTQFVDKGTGNRFYGEWEGDPYFVNHLTQVKCTTAKHSWYFGSMRDVVDYVIDTDTRPAVLSGVNVIMTVSPASGVYLTDCTVESVHKIDKAISLSDMEVKESWFAEGYNWSNLSVYGCDIVLDNFSSADTYVTIKNKQNEADYGDIGEQTLHGATLLPNCIIENGLFDGVTLSGAAELHNISGTMTVPGTPADINAIDCWLTVANSADCVVNTLALRRGSVASAVQVQVLSALLLDNCDVNAQFYTPGVEPQFIGCSVYSTQVIGRLCKFIDCRISGEIIQYPELATYVQAIGEGYYHGGEFIHNTWLGTGKLSLTPRSGADYSANFIGVIGKYVGNYSDHEFVVDEAWNGVAHDGIHISSLKYEDNHGGCPVATIEVTRDLPYINLWQPSDPSSYTTIPTACRNATGLWIVNDWRSGGSHDVATSMYWVMNLNAVPLDVSNLFRLKYIRTRSALMVTAEVQSFIRTDDNGFYMHNFTLHGPMTQTAVNGTDNTARLSLVQPCRFEYVGDRLYTNDDIDEKRSALWYVTYDYKNDATRFSANVKYTYGFSNS
jgi:hypothetical protein